MALIDGNLNGWCKSTEPKLTYSQTFSSDNRIVENGCISCRVKNLFLLLYCKFHFTVRLCN